VVKPCSLALRSGRWHSLRLELRGRCTAMAAFEYLASPTAGRQSACASPRWSWPPSAVARVGELGVDQTRRADQPRRRGWLARRRLAWVPPACGTSPRSRYSRARMGRSAPTVMAETLAGWLPSRITGPVVVVAGPVVVGAALVVGLVVVVGPVVDAMLVVDTSVVVDTAVLVGAVVVGPAVVGGAVTVGWVVAPTVEGAVVGVLRPTVAGAWAAADPVVVVGPLTARRPGFAVVEGGGAVGVSRGPVVVVVDADIGAGCVGDVGSATPGTRRGGSGWGSRVAEATMAASTAVVSPKTNSSSLQGRRGVARCRGGGVGMVRRPGLTCSSRLKGVRGSRTLTGHKEPSSA
jgi:hypothetical protein